MGKKYRGVRHLTGDTYFVDYQVGKIRKQRRIRANSDREAHIIRQELIVELRKRLPWAQTELGRLNADFNEAWQQLEASLLADKVCQKNMLRNRRTFQRFFEDFRKAKYPNITSVSQIPSYYLEEYRMYFVNTLGHNPFGGLRAELICVKSMIRRLHRLGYCGKEVVEALAQSKRPRAEKKHYVDIPSGKIREMLDVVKRDRPDYHHILYYIKRTGRRIGETLLIQRTDVVWDGLHPVRIDIRPETSKSKTPSSVGRLDDDLAQVILDAYKTGSKHKTTILFCSRRGKKVSQGTLQKYLRKVSKQVIGVEITPHYFRHRFLTECSRSQLLNEDAMAMAGIKDTNVVKKHYEHTTPAGLDKILAVTRDG